MFRAMLYLSPAIWLIVACSDNGVSDSRHPVTSEIPEAETTTPGAIPETGASDMTTAAKPQSPIRISYRIIGQPIVGQPVAIDLQVDSALGPQAITMSYRVNDPTALQLPEAQPASVSLAPVAGEERFRAQQVTVVPLREGRLYLNVSATVETDSGTLSNVTAIPIQVGAAQQAPTPGGEPGLDENGEAIIRMPAKED